MDYYLKAIPAWVIGIAVGVTVHFFAPEFLKRFWFELSSFAFIAIYYLVPPTLITGMRDLERAKRERPLRYYWEITAVTGLAIFLLVRIGLKLWGVV